MSAVRFVLLVLALASTEATAFAQAAMPPCAGADDPGHACSTIAEQAGASTSGLFVAKLPPQPLRATEDHVTAKERDTEPGYASNNALIKIASPGLDCIYANDAGNRVESIDHHGNATKCGDPRTGGTLVPGYVSEDHAAYNRNTGQFQVISYDDGKVYFVKFGAGARLEADGNCSTGCAGYVFATADAVMAFEHDRRRNS